MLGTINKQLANNRFKISTVIDQFRDVNKSMMVDDGYKGIIGTSNPYQFNLFSDLITNPSSVSISEFQKMAYSQPILSAGLTILNNLVINEFGPYAHEKKEYADFINNMIDSMLRPFSEILRDMLTALWAGFSIGEKRYKSDGRYVYVIDIEPRPAQSFIFRVDSQGHLKDDGIIQYYFNNLWTGYGNMLAFNGLDQFGQSRPNPYASRGDFDYPWRTVWAQPIGTVIIPKNKCIHFAYKGIDGLTSPYGRSLLRSAYDSYVVRAEMTRITRNAANFKAAPTPVVIVDPNSVNTEGGEEAFQQIAYSLETLGDPGGGNAYLLLKGRGGSTDASVWIDKIDSTANLQDVIAVNNYFDKMMLTSILFPSELAGLSDKGSYALGKTQQDLLGRNVDSIGKMLKSCLINKLVKPLLELNFGEKEDFGMFESSDNVAEDVALNMEKISALMSLGIKLKTETVMAMLDLKPDSVASDNNPIIDTNNGGINPVYSRNMREAFTSAR